MFEGFVRQTIAVEGARLRLVRAGAGAPLLLLHGYPQTSAAWHRVAPRLAGRFTLVIPDLPGYGDSVGEQHSKRAMARTLVGAMQALGHAAFAVAGHDRGGRVAYRMALDHPAHVTQLAVLDIVPTLEMVRDLTPERAGALFNWFFLAQPAPLPETLIGRAPEFYLRIRCPLLALWSESDLAGEWFDVLGVWRRWAKTVSGRSLSCGHFLMEESPDEVAAALRDFLL